jgi:hypothetical protein
MRNPEAWPGRWLIALAVAVLAAAAVVWWQTGARDVPAAVGVAPAPAPVATPAMRAPELPPPAVTPYPVRGEGGLSHDDPLTAYKKANVYPPTSRPLTAEQRDLLEPNTRHEDVRPTDKGLGTSYLFTADRYFVIGDETITATLEVKKKDQPARVQIRQAYAAVLDPTTHADKQIPLAFAPSGGRYVATFAPATLPLRRQTAISMVIEFDHGEGVQRGHFDFQYTPKAGIPARFTGVFRDEIRAGSLVVHAGVEVAAAGHYVIDCNLFDAADQPVAWTRFKGELAEGTHDAELEFFGKVILDGNARGPFHLGQLRGARYAPGEDPDLEQMPAYAGTYTTPPYGPERFSDAEYDSEEKRKMIELLSQDNGHRGGAAHDPP